MPFRPPAGARALVALNAMPAAATQMPPSEHSDFWHATVHAAVVAEAITRCVRELALQSVVTREIDGWVLRVEQTLNQPAVRFSLLQSGVSGAYGVKITIEVSGGQPARRSKKTHDDAHDSVPPRKRPCRPRRAIDDARLGCEDRLTPRPA
jgi:hypothetical protein